MGSITKRGNHQYRVLIRRKGAPGISKTFETLKEAREWEAVTEGEIRRRVYVDRSGLERTTLGALLTVYERHKARIQKPDNC
ncbi:hypothetical protein CCAE64S_01465 [Castellaniella caeni]